MHIEISNNEPSIDLVDGSPFLSFYFTDAGPLEDEMYQFINAVDQSPEECTLTIGVPLKKIIDGTIDGHRFINSPDRIVFDEAQRPLFDAIRADLIAAIEKIDSAEYKFEGEN